MVGRHARKISFFLLLVLLTALPLAAAEIENPYTQARFEISSDPTVKVLYVRLVAGLSGTFKSLSLYGDGRLVLEEGRAQHIAGEYSSMLSFEESRALVRLAVDHGLAEWNEMTFEAKVLEINNGKPLTRPTDASHLGITLSLARYQRGSYEVEDHQREIFFYAPRQVNRFHPGILEVEGMMALVERLRGTLRALKEEASKKPAGKKP